MHLQAGKLSTGDSLDMSPHDEAAIIANDATLKDMEVLSMLEKSDQLIANGFTECAP